MLASGINSRGKKIISEDGSACQTLFWALLSFITIGSIDAVFTLPCKHENCNPESLSHVSKSMD
jgi:hypothetical protein